MERLDYRTWMQQPLIWTERLRSRALVWTPGASWFINDPLGHLPHIHAGASEIIYMAAGTMDITVGGGVHRVGPGELLFMPPDSYQDYALIGNETACMFVLVVPNVKDARWQYKDFPPEVFQARGTKANLSSAVPLPSDERIKPRVWTLAVGETRVYEPESHREKVIYLLDGRAEVRVDRLSGLMQPNDYFHVPATYAHSIANAGRDPLRYLECVCFDPTT